MSFLMSFLFYFLEKYALIPVGFGFLDLQLGMTLVSVQLRN